MPTPGERAEVLVRYEPGPPSKRPLEAAAKADVEEALAFALSGLASGLVPALGDLPPLPPPPPLLGTVARRGTEFVGVFGGGFASASATAAAPGRARGTDAERAFPGALGAVTLPLAGLSLLRGGFCFARSASYAFWLMDPGPEKRSACLDRDHGSTRGLDASALSPMATNGAISLAGYLLWLVGALLRRSAGSARCSQTTYFRSPIPENKENGKGNKKGGGAPGR